MAIAHKHTIGQDGEGEKSVDGEDDCCAAVNEEDTSPVKISALRTEDQALEVDDDSDNGTLDTTPTDHSDGKRGMIDSDQEEEEELERSAISLMSSMTPASPLTLSSSSLNLLGKYCSDCDAESDTARPCYRQECQNQNHSRQNDRDESANYFLNAAAILSKAKVTAPVADGVFTKRVTQRIDARTNYDCFTGNVDAVTGDLIYGTMLYRETGTVYEGPFITKYETSEIESGGNVSLRHGENATCSYSNGMNFAGSFEFDRPKAGTWIGGDWSYEGPLIAVIREEGHDDPVDKGGDDEGVSSKRDLYSKYGSPAASSLSSGDVSGDVATNSPKQRSLRAIGIPRTLPGPVLFHGNGRFARSDGLVYEGEFLCGLANGVGKEIFPGGRGVYQGEFADGLRHGVGTLIEDYYDEESSIQKTSRLGQPEDIGEDGGKRVADRQEQTLKGNGFVPTLDSIVTCKDSSTNNVDSSRSIDTGPDFAAGCIKPSTDTSIPNAASSGVGSSIPATSNTSNNDSITYDATSALFPSPKQKTPKSPNKCRRWDCHQHPAKTTKKRYSSGVWCAGQYEIEDCRGTVHPGSNEFTDESSHAAASATAATGSDGNDSNPNDVSLNRTTWDMLDEKWLGI
eukprot:CAMPEP_0181088924 /NCGR_PEP_ID=MMETSP1071-20121207/7036_1 /TAXON_ID=35127 /ORGANISM="Thalassiosira sp., Strain NH16" /LENGTH=625 /DNA_ID=CAMNT_0023170853 /DNA_START=93 /DNA_END=1969 /DNA_ORIENTATION=-